MSAEAMKVSSVLDTSHLKVKFPFKVKIRELHKW